MGTRPLCLMCLVSALILFSAGVTLAQNVTPPAQQGLPQPDQAPKQVAPEAPQPGSKAEESTLKQSSSAALPAGMEKAFERILDKKLAPISRTLAEMQEQKIRLTDVLGGLGYIFGLVGVAAYFKRRPIKD